MVAINPLLEPFPNAADVLLHDREADVGSWAQFKMVDHPALDSQKPQTVGTRRIVPVWLLIVMSTATDIIVKQG